MKSGRDRCVEEGAGRSQGRARKEVNRKDEKISEQEQEIAELKKKLAMYEEHGND